MSFDDMPDRGPLTEPGAQEFADRAIELSREAVAATRTGCSWAGILREAITRR